MESEKKTIEIENLIRFLSGFNQKIISISIKENRIKVYTDNTVYCLKKGEENFVKIKTKQKPNRKNNYKTKKAKLSHFSAKFVISASLLAILGSASNLSKNNSKAFANQQMAETITQKDELAIQNNQDLFFSLNHEEKNSQLKLVSNKPTMLYQNISIEHEIIQSQRIKKRVETDNLFGDTIEKWSKRWGASSSLMKALITQERDENNLSNPGQLTRNICGEKIILPIINKSKEDIASGKEVDKIFIIREEPNKANYQNEEEYLYQLELHKKQVEKSKELKQEGYEIIFFPDLLGEQNCDKNIQIAIAFATFNNYRLNDPVLATFAYNAGYYTTKKAQLDEILNGQVGTDQTDKNYLTHVFRFLYPEEVNNLKFITKNFPENWDDMTYDQRNYYMSIGIKDVPYTYTFVSLENFKEYIDEKEIRHNSRR
ncbi:MAG: hypothetical protein HFI09_02940 [Bacilli bacterium]|nr:hypothetical protein [Bacilli bacterium]